MVVQLKGKSYKDKFKLAKIGKPLREIDVEPIKRQEPAKPVEAPTKPNRRPMRRPSKPEKVPA